MQALRLYAGPAARRHIERHGLQPAHIGTIPAAAGGPKGLMLGPLDRFIFGEWLPRSAQPVHLIGASIGAWRMVTACMDAPVPAFEALERGYIHGEMTPPPGRKLPLPAQVSATTASNLRAMYEGHVPTILSHPRYRLHVLASRGRHLLAREGRWRTPAGYVGAALTNVASRRAMGGWIERVVFSSVAAGPLPFGTRDYRTRQCALTTGNFYPVLQASGSIPFFLEAVHDIPGAPPGAYWDGGITDYHLHLNYTAPDSAADGAGLALAGGQSDSQDLAGALVLYPHFQRAVVPGWLDKGLKWRHRATPFLDRMLVLAPDPDWVRRLPGGKLPDRNDFQRLNHAERVRVWTAAVQAACQLADEFADWLQRPDMGRVHSL
ncbi:MAG: phospholipase [Pseudomonadota bacterium]|nr:phospholipase [Pseudomonadota bacterium]